MVSTVSEIPLEALREKQRKMARRIILEDGFSKINKIGGFDVAYSEEKAYPTGVVLDYKSLEVLEVRRIKTKIDFPYIPTFLGFREAPAVVKVYKMLKNKPDIIMVNGQGVAHPLRLGLASHLGLLLDRPTIGIAQNRLVGECEEPEKEMDFSRLFLEGKQVGWVLKTKKDQKPIFISPGHRISMKSSLEIVIHCLTGRKLPEPLRLAHIYASRTKTN